MEQIKSARYTEYRNAFYNLISILFSNLTDHQSFIPHLTPTSAFHLYTHTHTHTYTHTHTHTHTYTQTVAIVVSFLKLLWFPKSIMTVTPGSFLLCIPYLKIAFLFIVWLYLLSFQY